MIEIALTLVDYLIKLLQHREEKIDEYFERYVLPAYEAAEAVYSDYLILLTEIQTKIEQHEPPENLILFLEKGRIKYLPIRMRVRAEIANRFPTSYWHDFWHERERFEGFVESSDFERGIMGILMGGLAPFEDSIHNNTLYYRGHTLLDILYNFSLLAKSGADENVYLQIVTKQKEAITEAWQDVVKGFAEYKRLAVPTPSNKRLLDRQNMIKK